jgi:hypothetical protein
MTIPQAVKRLDIKPDIELAEKHLTLLDEEAEFFTFQTFDDDKLRKKHEMEQCKARGIKYKDPLARIFNGTLEQCASALIEFNRRGAGVYVTVNAMDGKERRNANITRIRAIFQEDDGDGTALPCDPHCVIESSPGKYHRYVLVDGLSIDEFRLAQEAVVVRHGSDPNAKDPARVLRLAGFFHLKNPATPWMVRIVAEGGGLPLPRLEVARLFPPLTAAEKTAAAAGSSAAGSVPATAQAAPAGAVSDALVRDLRSALMFLRADERDIWVRLGMALKPLGDVGRGLWFDWSMTSEKFNALDAARVWDSFKPSQIGYRTIFEEAQDKGWVNPAKRLAEPALLTVPPSIVVDITTEMERRRVFEKRIDDDSVSFDQLVYVLFPEIEQSGLLPASRELLAKRLAKKAGVSVATLRAGMADAEPPTRPPRGDADVPDFVSELNKRHAVITQQGATRIMTVEQCPEFKRTRVSFTPRADFILRYENRDCYFKGESMNWGDAWLKHPDRREFRGVVFAPGMETDADIYNLWQGFGYRAEIAGSCDKYVEFVKEIICRGDDEAFLYVWGWLAHMVQRPWELPGASLVLRGAPGTGKNTFVEILGEIVNAVHFVALTRMEHLTGQFSAHRAGALLIYANEACWGGDRQAEGALKSMVTDSDDLMEAKHQNAIRVKRYARLIVASNNEWPVPRDEQDRRFVVLEPLDTRQEDGDYFAAIKSEMGNGGYETLLYLLQQADISDWSPRQIPRNLRERGWDMKLRSIPGGVAEWWLECLEEGFVCHDPGGPEGYAGRAWREIIPTRQVQESYSAWCRRRGYPHPVNIKQLGGDLQRWGAVRCRPGSGTIRPWCYVWPELEKSRRDFQEALLIPADWWSDGAEASA